MPSSIFSHQAPALALKVKFPKNFDGTALCLGTLLPDFNFIFDFFFPFNFYAVTHSLIGQILWTIPLTIIATYVFSQFLGPFCAKTASREGISYKPLRYFGIDQWKYIKNKRYTKKSLLIITYSALVGGLTHILLDWPSHRYVYILFPWKYGQNFDFLLYSIVDYGMINLGPFKFEANLTLFNLLWLIESIITLIITLCYLRYIKKRDLIRIWYERDVRIMEAMDR